MATNAEAAKPVIMNEEELKRKQREKLKKLQATGGNPRPARSLFLFTLKNPFRKACINIVEWKYPLYLAHSIRPRRDIGLTLHFQSCLLNKLN